MEPIARAHDPLNAEWVTGLFLLALIVLAAVNRSAPRKWRFLLREGLRMRQGPKALRDELDLQDRNYLGIVFFAIATTALFAWQALHIEGVDHVPAYLSLMGILTGVLVALWLVVRLSGLLASSEAGTGEHARSGSIILALLGLALFPVVVLMAYQADWRDELVQVGYALVATAMLYRWVRGAWVAMADGVPIRYIILYFCAAEAMPLLLAIHALRPPIHPTLNL